MNALAPACREAFVHAITWAGTDMLCYDLRSSVPGEALPAFEAGAHIDVHVAPGLVRQYSLCNNPSERHRYVVCVHRVAEGRGGSRALHDALRTGQTVRISAPRNHFQLEDAKRYVLVGGGIGVTPLAAMAECLYAREADFELHIYASTPDRVPLAEQLVQGPLSANSRVHLSSDGDSLRRSPPTAVRTPDPSTLIYTCGPEGFMQAVAEYALAAGFTPEQIRQERFQPAIPDISVAGAENTFDIVIASTGQRIAVSADQTIADALSDNGVEVDLSCEQGMCGACLTPVLSGIPDHRDDVQTAAEHEANSHITVCCSRARTAELVLDL